MTAFIRLGGAGVIVAVFGIFGFIVLQVLPLFGGAKVREIRQIPIPDMDVAAVALDEWAELPLLVGADGSMQFVDLVGDRGTFELPLALAGLEAGFSAVRYDQRTQTLLFGLDDGKVILVGLSYRPLFGEDGTRTIEPEMSVLFSANLGTAGHPVRQIAYGQSSTDRLIAVLQEVDGSLELRAIALRQRRTLMGVGKLEEVGRFDLTGKLSGAPVHLSVPSQADALVVATETGTIDYLFRSAEGFEMRQSFEPFGESKDTWIGRMDFLLGDVSLVVTDAGGMNRVFSLFQPEGSGVRLFGKTREFEPLPGPSVVFAGSLRNKAFLIGTENHISLRYATTTNIRWKADVGFGIKQAILGEKYNRIVLLGDDDLLHIYALADHHPEAGWRAYFGKIWYEGAPGPAFVWQSTGSSDEFEPKLSMIPLIVGSLKGTLYALLFAVPVAVLAGVYTSQFLKPGLKNVVKPAMEIMASLPSVVLGFLAALWLAPLIETKVPALILMGFAVPGTAVGFGWFWARLPYRYRSRISPGWEFLVFVPVLLGTVWLCGLLGPVLERFAFVYIDPLTGEGIADFRMWWPQVTGTAFEQRNSLVVGFMMGFAVIPIIFTIAEDALSNVPTSIISGSLALGASRWQTVWKIVIPTAAAGIFSALMIGLGRAVGETMIVVMATGNTPILDMGVFTGMRTLSANIAVELPEAPQGGTLYRTLFLGALLLFLLTFLVNTVAEVIRQRLRERFKVV